MYRVRREDITPLSKNTQASTSHGMPSSYNYAQKVVGMVRGTCSVMRVSATTGKVAIGGQQ